MRSGLCIIGWLLAGQTLGWAGPKETVFDFKALTATPLNPKTLKTATKGGIVTEEVRFHSEKDGGKSVDIFAYSSYPKGARKLPAFVWNQPGLYPASTHWTEFGARRGYAVLSIDFPQPEYRFIGGYPINAGLELGADPRQAPIYHGAVALLKAVSYLETRAEVDKKRIGMAGSSWGGFFTTLMVGIDPRLKAGSCVYGSGNLQMGNNWWDANGFDAKRDGAFRKHWQTTLDPAWRLAQSKTPIAWFTGTNDSFYWLPAVMKTYEGAAGPRHLTLLPNWNHALTPALDEMAFAWLDTHLHGKPDFLKVSPVEVVKEMGKPAARWTFHRLRKVKAAELILSYGDVGNWQSRYESPGMGNSDSRLTKARSLILLACGNNLMTSPGNELK
jgi:dienelactone hydrolase